MSEVFSYRSGDSPLLVSVPHDGRDIPEAIRARMTAAGLDIPDTDWHVAALYAFARDVGASTITANYSRYVVDLNRSAADEVLYPGQLVTGLCPHETFAGDAIYADGQAVDDAERSSRIERYWRPYHDRIAATFERLREAHGYALLWDAHSIPSRVPRLFDGELPVLNIGSFDDRSCDPRITATLLRIAESSPYDVVLNGRFKGGYITRHYGRPRAGVHAVQLELAQRAYMDETRCRFDEDKASQLRDTLGNLLDGYLTSAKEIFNA